MDGGIGTIDFTSSEWKAWTED